MPKQPLSKLVSPADACAIAAVLAMSASITQAQDGNDTEGTAEQWAVISPHIVSNFTDCLEYRGDRNISGVGYGPDTILMIGGSMDDDSSPYPNGAASALYGNSVHLSANLKPAVSLSISSTGCSGDCHSEGNEVYVRTTWKGPGGLERGFWIDRFFVDSGAPLPTTEIELETTDHEAFTSVDVELCNDCAGWGSVTGDVDYYRITNLIPDKGYTITVTPQLPGSSRLLVDVPLPASTPIGVHMIETDVSHATGLANVLFRATDPGEDSIYIRVSDVADWNFNGREPGGPGHLNIEIYTITIEPTCVADYAGGHDLNFDDVLAFVQLFSDEDPGADLALPNGVYNFDDVSRFLTLFGEGCP